MRRVAASSAWRGLHGKAGGSGAGVRQPGKLHLATDIGRQALPVVAMAGGGLAQRARGGGPALWCGRAMNNPQGSDCVVAA